MQCTHAQLVIAFADWETAFRDDPTQFVSDEVKASTPVVEYGESCANHLVKLIKAQKTSAQ